MDDLEVNSKLTAIVIDDQNSDAATTCLEGFRKARPEVGLINDRKVLLDITSLGHGNDSAILKIKNTVLLEDRSQHGLDDDGRAGVGDEGGLLMQLLGEEVDTQVAVLTSGRGGCDADDLARTTLEDQEIAEADVMGGDGDGVWWWRHWGGGANWSTTTRSRSFRDGYIDFFTVVMRVVVRVVMCVVM